MAASSAPLFGVDVPEGFQYRTDFIKRDEEAVLADDISRVRFLAFEMRGVVARRRVAFFGRAYDVKAAAPPPMPAFLESLREKVAAWANVDPHAFAMALINEYPPGAPIGWHRDAPQYDIVAGISLLSDCRMKFRPYLGQASSLEAPGGRRSASHEVLLEPRSAYVMTAAARNQYEHHIAAVSMLRYSITFRTIRP